MAYGKQGEVWLIGAAIYVVGMLIVFYYYQYQGIVNPGFIALISIGGAFLTLSQMFLGAFDEKPSKQAAGIKEK